MNEGRRVHQVMEILILGRNRDLVQAIGLAHVHLAEYPDDGVVRGAIALWLKRASDELISEAADLLAEPVG